MIGSLHANSRKTRELEGMMRSYLPAQAGDKVLVGLAAGRVGQYGVFVLLALRHVKHCYFVSLSAGGERND